MQVGRRHAQSVPSIPTMIKQDPCQQMSVSNVQNNLSLAGVASNAQTASVNQDTTLATSVQTHNATPVQRELTRKRWEIHPRATFVTLASTQTRRQLTVAPPASPVRITHSQMPDKLSVSATQDTHSCPTAHARLVSRERSRRPRARENAKSALLERT